MKSLATNWKQLSIKKLKPFLVAIATVVMGHAQAPVYGQVHSLPNYDQEVRIEGENCSRTAGALPRVVSNPIASGGKYLGYFWQNSWFEIDVNSPDMANYVIQFRAAAPRGATLDLQLVSETGNTSLVKVPVVRSGNWRNYSLTQPVTVSLPPGTQTLRVINLGFGIDVDYLSIRAGSIDEIRVRELVLNDGPDVNPLKGFNSGWWRPNDDYASVGFQYIEWGKLEPQRDSFDWKYVEEVLNRDGSRNRHLILQFVVDWDNWGMAFPEGDSHYKGPQWLLDLAPERRGPADLDDFDSRITRASNYDHPVFVAEAVQAIEALSEYLRDDPRAFVLQVGVLGFWGEWHNYPRHDWTASDLTKAVVLSTYLQNLGNDGLTQVRYPDEPVNVPTRGMGYTNGSAVPSEHGYEFGLLIEADELWKNGPVGGEWPPTYDELKPENIEYWNRFFRTSEGLSFLELGRYSTVMIPEDKHILERIPNWNRDNLFWKMHRRMGYNFQVSKVRSLASKDLASRVFIEFDLKNAGIAPFYKDWNTQVAILDANSGELAGIVDIDTDLRELAPGASSTFKLAIPADLEPDREYAIGLRFIQPGSNEPKSQRWKLDSRYTYVELANDIDVVAGTWNQENALQGSWNILDSFSY